jgi:two-component system osmolarity sensor histidine kinase EnvZ
VLIHKIVREMEETSTLPPNLTLSIEDNLPPVAGVPAYVERVLRELFHNAEKYGRQGEPGPELQAWREGNEVVVRVLDRGVGIEESETESIFERFYRSERTARFVKGAGLGLTVCKRLIEAQSGRIWARPREGGGLELGFALPVGEGDG